MDKTGYIISSQLQSDSRYVTYKALDSAGKQITLKVLKNSYPTAQSLNKFRKEFEILSKATHPNIIGVERIEPYQNSLALIMEYVDGKFLSDLEKKESLDLSSFFSIAIPLTDAVKFLHHQQVIHKNINPGNIIIESVSKQPKLTGFNLATQLSREEMQPNTREIIDAELPYISPEQTGRMNRNIDTRTDLYSLGILFYKLLTGSPPFTGSDPMQIIHSHIAKQPKSPEKINDEIPVALSKIILKLLSKSADDRYQSASGLLDDLQICFDGYKKKSVITDFNPGATDIHDQFRIPDKLYGRTNELQQLLSYYKEAAKGGSEIALVSGYSGVGKSRLVSEVKKVIYEGNGYFVSGKFDQFKRDVPLSSLLQAMSQLIRQILSESDEKIAEWKRNVMLAVGQNGKIITDVIPEVEMLIGPQSMVAELPPMEANNRFNLIFSRFVKTFTRPGHPLCIFLDDLQWIDSATRQWIETHLTAEDLTFFMLIGAFRDNEVTPSHPLMMMLERLHRTPTSINEINLQPLDKATLNQMVADVLVTEPEKCADLSDLIYRKTNGNPFFSRQCLLTLHEEKAIYFEPEDHRWKYVLEKAHNAAISDNVVELMLAQIQQLSPSVQDKLKIASCIGNEFSIQLLNKLSDEKMEATATQISIAVQKGLVLPVYSWNTDDIEKYKFLHDRVQQATSLLLNEAEKKSIRLKIGRILLENVSSFDTEDKIYDIADHLNFAADLVTDRAEVEKLVEVNLAASIRAKNATAYEPALRYSKESMDLIPKDEVPNAMISKLLLQRAECEHLNGHNETAENYYEEAIDKTDGLLNKAKVYQRKIHYYNNLRKFHEAYQTGRTAVALLGVSLPSKFIPPDFLKDVVLNRFLLGRKKIPDIINMKEMTDENLRMAILLMATFGRSAYQIKPELCIAVCTKMVNICLEHGNADGGFIGYLAFGPIFMGAILKRKQSGFDYGELILALVEKYKSQFYKAETHFVVGYFAIPWRRPATEMERYWQIAYEAGLEVGDFFHTSCAICGTIQSYYMRGMPFNEIEKAANRYLEFLKRIKNTDGILTLASVQQSIKNLRGETASRISLNSDDFNEDEYVNQLPNFDSRHFAHYYYINKMQTLYLWGEYQKAYEVSLISDRYLKDSPGMLHTAEHFFYKALIICSLYKDSKGKQRFKWKRTLQNISNKFRNYSKGCPSNFIHKWQLIQAEMNRLESKNELAQNKYYAAIESASKYGYTNVLALAHSLTGSFHFNGGRSRLAGFHLRNAHYSYHAMGATAYSQYIMERFPGLAEFEGTENLQGSEVDAIKRKPANLDLTTILKSSEAISREIRLRDLLGSLLKIIIENAGAERMVLLINKEDGLVAQATCIAGNEEVEILPEIPLDQYKSLSKPVVNYVARTQQPVILDDASANGDFTNDIYFQDMKTRSVLCAPLVQQGKLTGIIYLENNLTNGAFTKERIELLILLSGQMAISIENALLYENLEEKVQERTRQLNEEKNISESLLRNILPEETAEELKRTGVSKAKDFPQVSVLFTDFKNFTSITENLDAQELVNKINYCYSAFDNIVSKYGVEKIKTIGDSYMCAGGLPVEKATNPYDTLRAALDIRDFMLEQKRKQIEKGEPFFEIRIGVHTGPIVAGIVGIKKFAYDIWGDTVNMASRMESSCEPGKVNISGTTYELVKDQFNCTYRGKHEAKNKGMVDMYFVESLKDEVELTEGPDAIVNKEI